MEITFLGLSIPFLGTALGSAMVFFMRREMKDSVQRALLGFAAGVMIAASFGMNSIFFMFHEFCIDSVNNRAVQLVQSAGKQIIPRFLL